LTLKQIASETRSEKTEFKEYGPDILALHQ